MEGEHLRLQDDGEKKKGVEYGPAAIREAGLLKRLSLLE
ncbi:Arginase-2, mitochondrial [Apodemus speciosus]|uniref:Arginase-2, mitochondrial n=1 Tax=Apodemus speciosus TaxID=105296 RepID=A0ABQ0FEC6_APOSI